MITAAFLTHRLTERPDFFNVIAGQVYGPWLIRAGIVDNSGILFEI